MPPQALKERETAIESMVQPIRDALARTEAQIQAIERDRIDSFATIKSQMEGIASGQNLLSRETRNLVTALRRPDVRGRWGEITLKRLVELSGMSSHVDFTEQQHSMTDSGPIRPDMIVHMPEQRDIVVDVKTPLGRLSVGGRGAERRRAEHAARRHAQLVGARVRELASKSTGRNSSAAPTSSCCSCRAISSCRRRCRRIPALIDDAMRQNVMLATPTSLVALLKAVAYGWKQTALAENAAEMRAAGRGHCTSAWRCSASTWQSSANRSAAASRRSTGPWVRWSSKCCPLRGVSNPWGCA